MASSFLSPLLRRLSRPTAPLAARAFSSSSPAAEAAGAPLAATALHDWHVGLGAKMVEFAGYSMPVQYPDGVLKSHVHTRARSAAGLFDVSHMGQLRFHGADRAAFLERCVVADVAALAKGHASLSVITTPCGGILDDCIITNAGDHLYVVVNAGNKHIDMAHFKAMMDTHSGDDVEMEYISDQAIASHRSLLALQGPGAAEVMQRYMALDLASLPFMNGAGHGMDLVLGGALGGAGPVIVSRLGYTGEDGFELSMLNEHAEMFATELLAQPEVMAVGLAARDSLRLEAGLCLHGHDIDTVTTPVEAALTWTIGKRRREEGGFVGAETILSQLKGGGAPIAKKRVGLLVAGAPAREGAEIYAADGETRVGTLTSGGPSPCLKQNIGMGYVDRGHFKLGTALKVKGRKKMQDAVVSRMPFVESNYFSN